MINWNFHAAVIYSVLLELKKIFHWKHLSTLTLMKLQNTLQCSIYSATLTAFSFWGHISYFLILKRHYNWAPLKMRLTYFHAIPWIFMLSSNRMKEIKSTHVNKFPFVCFSVIWEICSPLISRGLNLKCPKKWVIRLRQKSVFIKVIYLCWIKAAALPAQIQLWLLKHVQAGYLMPLQECRSHINTLKIKSIWKFLKSNTNPRIILYVQENQPTIMGSQL